MEINLFRKKTLGEDDEDKFQEKIYTLKKLKK